MSRTAEEELGDLKQIGKSLAKDIIIQIATKSKPKPLAATTSNADGWEE